MNREQFLNKLNDSLKNLPLSEREDILQDFEEHFEIGLSNGKTEEEIIKGLGSPQHIAKEMVATYRLEQVEESASTGNILRAVWAVVTLGFFNLIIVLGPFIALVAIVFAAWITGLAFVVSPLLYLVNVIIFPEIFTLFEMFATLFLSGLGILIVVGMIHVTRWLFKGFVKYLNFNMKMVKGGMKNA